MDGLSAAAGVIAVASLAIQLAENTNKLVEFWSSIQHAPEEIRDISSELESLANVLQQIGHEAEHHPPSQPTLSALTMCAERINVTNSITASFKAGLLSNRTKMRRWSSLKAVFSRDKIEAVQKSLSRMKDTLILTMLNDARRSSRLRDETYAQNVQTLMHQLSAMTVCNHDDQAEISSTGLTNASSQANIWDSRPRYQRAALPAKRTVHQDEQAVVTWFGTFRLKSQVRRLFQDNNEPCFFFEEDSFEHEKTFHFIPPRWMAQLGFSRGISGRVTQSAFSGPSLVLGEARPVHDDALIFSLCSKGDLRGIQDLLGAGEASVRDVDSYGRTPLYVAAQCCHVELCKFLIGCGADRDARIYRDARYPYSVAQNPLFVIARNQFKTDGREYDPTEVIDILRLFIDLVDVRDSEYDYYTSGSHLLDTLNEYYRDPDRSDAEKDVFLWALEVLGPDMWRSLKENTLNSTLGKCLDLELRSRADHLTALFPHAIDSTTGLGTYSLLHKDLMLGGRHVSEILRLGANVNLSGFDASYSPFTETPVSFALWRATHFVSLREALKLKGADLDQVIGQDLQQPPVQFPHLTKEFLVELFSTDVDFSLFFDRQQVTCPSCRRCYPSLLQPLWITALETIANKPKSLSIQDALDFLLENAPKIANKDYGKLEERCSADLVYEEQSLVTKGNNNQCNELESAPAGFECFGYLYETQFHHDETCDSCNICAFCWHEYQERRLESKQNRSEKCTRCGSHDALYFGSGKGPRDKGLCPSCEQTERLGLQDPCVDSTGEDEAEEDRFSPFLIHT